jgi:hypothetical protein
LQAQDEQPLPEPVEAFINTNKKQGRALQVAGMLLLIECTDEQTARAIAAHKCTKDLCQFFYEKSVGAS